MRDPVVALLLARYRLALLRDPDLSRRPPWYRVEGERVRAAAAEAGVDPARAIAAAAVLSPAVRWEDLVRRLPAFLAAFRADPAAVPPRFPGYRSNVVKAWRVLAGQARATGRKVSRFALNLAGDERPVTVDRWAARAAGLPEGGGAAWYRRLESSYRVAASVAGLPPSRFQAVLWAAVREGMVPWGPLDAARP